jgi:hypothetical protein
MTYLACFGSTFLISSYPWFLKTFSTFQNPIFPFYNGFFKSSFYAYTNFKDLRFGPKTLFEAITFPVQMMLNFSKVAELPVVDFKWLVFYLISIIVLFKYIMSKKFENDSKNILIIFFVLSFIIWQTVFSIYRYLIPIELLLVIVIAVLLNYLVSLRKIKLYFFAFVFLISIWNVEKITTWGRASFGVNYASLDLPSKNLLGQYQTIFIVDPTISWIIPLQKSSASFIHINPFGDLRPNNNYISLALSKVRGTKSAIIALCSKPDLSFLPLLDKYGIVMASKSPNIIQASFGSQTQFFYLYDCWVKNPISSEYNKK